MNLARVSAPVESYDRLGRHLGIELLVQRDDLLPFPLPGNKVRKISAELAGLSSLPEVIITTGGIDSNHCRTTAWMAAKLGVTAHLVLHGEPSDDAASLRLLSDLGATYVVVDPQGIPAAIETTTANAARRGARVHIIPGGCHTARGARAYRDVAESVFRAVAPDVVFVASGTGATQGGLAAAAGSRQRVIGVSVARSAERGRPAVLEAAAWAGGDASEIEFTDAYVAGGYGTVDERTAEAVALGWRFGLPLDGTYTGKAFAALVDHAQSPEGHGKRVLFWHTGGLWNRLAENGGKSHGEAVR